MPVKVRCPSCEKVFAAPDAARGKAVKCPQCESRVAVPDGDSEKRPATAKAGADKAKKKTVAKEAKPADSEDFLKSLDLRRVEDSNARICSKCGYDMHEMDEEETECPKCGFDIEAGGLGAKAKKKQLKGPDPADFYPGLAKGAWKFVLKNQILAWRTAIYSLVCLLISMLCGFLYLWISAWPPRAFMAMCFFVAFLVIPGWLWNLDTEVIKLTLERKDKFKRLNFDFFLASAKGVMFVAWLIVGAAPILALPALLGYYLVYQSGQPEWVGAICVALGAIPVLSMLPVVMSHMTMPIPLPGWMFWKVITFSFRCAGALCICLLWFFLASTPLISGAAVIGGVWGNDIVSIVRTMEDNADRSRKILAAERAPRGGGKKGPTTPFVEPSSLPQPVAVDLKPLIGPAVILLVMCVPLGFIGMFIMRIHGQFTYYYKERLELIDKAKEYKYVAKERRRSDDDDDDGGPRTLKQDATDGVVFAVLFALIGGIGGMLFGSLTSAGVTAGVLSGVMFGVWIAGAITGIMLIVEGFKESVGWGLIVWFVPFGVFVFIAQHWERTRKLCFQYITLLVLAGGVGAGFAIAGLSMMPQNQPAADQGQPQGPMMMQGMQQGGMQQPGGMMQPGQMQPQGVPANNPAAAHGAK